MSSPKDSVQRPGGCAALAAAALACLLAPLAAQANTLGGATVSVNRVAGQPASQEIVIPWLATDFVTPPANLSAAVGYPNQPPTLRAQAHAIAGIDLSDGSLYGSISTFARNELPGVASRASANSTVIYQDTFQVLSDTLPPGTLVDVNFDLLFRHAGSLGTTGLGACCSIGGTYSVSVEGNIAPYDSSYRALYRTGTGGWLVGGVNGEPIELNLGRYSAEALVGGSFYFGIYFEIESTAVANAVWQDPRNYPGQSEAAGSGALFVATEITPAGAGLAAARAPAGSAYLFSPTGGFALPGIEAFDPANLEGHWLPPIAVPEPGTAVLLTLGLALLGVRVRH